MSEYGFAYTASYHTLLYLATERASLFAFVYLTICPIP